MFKTINNTLCTVTIVNVPEKTFTEKENVAYNGTDDKTLKAVQKTLKAGERAVSVSNVHKVSELRKMDFETFYAYSVKVDKYDVNRVCRNVKQWLCNVTIVNLDEKTFTEKENVAYNGTDDKTLKAVQKTLKAGERAVSVSNIHAVEEMRAMDTDKFIEKSEVVNLEEVAHDGK